MICGDLFPFGRYNPKQRQLEHVYPSKITGGMKNGELFIYILLSKCAYSNFKPNVITSSDTEREFMLEFNASVARP